jgi:hypothetical protein
MGYLHLSMVDWFYLFLAVAGLLLCLGFSVRQMLPSRIPTTWQGRIRHSLIGGILTGGFLLALLAIAFILDKQATWSLSDFISIVLCCVLPFQIIATIGIYFSFLQIDWMRRRLTHIAEEAKSKTSEPFDKDKR